jgi:hypothetical protein
MEGETQSVEGLDASAGLPPGYETYSYAFAGYAAAYGGESPNDLRAPRPESR